MYIENKATCQFVVALVLHAAAVAVAVLTQQDRHVTADVIRHGQVQVAVAVQVAQRHGLRSVARGPSNHGERLNAVKPRLRCYKAFQANGGQTNSPELRARTARGAKSQCDRGNDPQALKSGGREVTLSPGPIKLGAE